MRSDSAPQDPRLQRALARLSALVDWERSDRRADMGRTLEPVLDLLERLGDPHRAWRSVHVAGTKGKSTTASFIAAGLSRAGLRTGAYSSPHVERLVERVRIDGAPIDEAALAEGLDLALAAREAAGSESPSARSTYFDVLTAGAFEALRAAGVEWVVVECGLGGRLDSTNAVQGEVCVITNIDLEHTEVLGGTRALIAAEKAGILDPGATLVTSVAADDEAGAVIARRARELGCEVLRPASPTAGAASAPISVEAQNAALAALVLDELGRRGVRGARAPFLGPLSGELLDASTLAAARLPGRGELFHVRAGGRTIAVGLDGAHVASSLARVARELTERAGGRADAGSRPTAVLALRNDKDVASLLKTLSAAVDTVFCTSLDDAPFFGAEDLVVRARAAGLAAEAVAEPETALERALEHAARRGVPVLVLGSLYLCGRLRPVLRRRAVD